MNKNFKIFSVVLLFIITIGLITMFILLLTGKTEINILKSKLVYDEVINETFNNIQISTKGLDVELVKSTDELVNVKLYDIDSKNFSIKVEDNTLKINSNNVKHNLFFSFGKRKVIVSLPQKEYDLLIKSKSGDIMSKLDFNNTTIVTTSGDIKLEKCNKLNINVTSGDIIVKEVNDINIDATSGDVKIDTINNSINVKTKSGDIVINELAIKEDSSINLISGDIIINRSSNNIFYNTKSISGDIRINNNNNRYADYELRIETKSGDIIVK